VNTVRLSHLLLSSVLILTPLLARADNLLFTLSGPESGTFLLSSTPSVTLPSLTCCFTVAPIAATNPLFDSITFYSSGLGGGFTDLDGLLGWAGVQVYSGSEFTPTFAPGSWVLAPFDLLSGLGSETLTITDPPSSAPEPSSLIMLGTGALGLLGFSRRRPTL
jgi:hypothetical protein